MPAIQTTHPLTVGRGRRFATLASAIDAANAGDEIAVDTGVYSDEIVQIDKPLRIVGVGGTPVFQATGLLKNGKGIFLTRADVTIENITFRDAAALRGNGAGIRHERGNLIVQRCIFRANQNGVFAADDPEATVVVTDSEFIGNGAGDGHTHGLYVATELASLRVERSIFVGTLVGHHLKSRAREIFVSHSTFGDGASGRTSYAIDIPNGGIASISENRLTQGPNAEHFALLNYGGEGMKYRNNSIDIRENFFRGNGSWLSVAVRNRSHVVASLVGNQFDQISVRLWGRGRLRSDPK